jgi:hypothetical protein
MRNFGGWGLRYGKYSKAYIVTGDKCVELELADGSRLYINTLEPEKFLSALTKAGRPRHGSCCDVAIKLDCIPIIS